MISAPNLLLPSSGSDAVFGIWFVASNSQASDMLKKIFFVLCFAFAGQLTFAQVDYNKQFFNGKQLFREGKYNLAMEFFKPLIPYDRNNAFSEYAAFYYAVSAYHQGYGAVAKDQLNHIKTTYPKWDKLDEVNLWLGKIHMDNHDYFQGMKVLTAIHDKKLEKDIIAVKQKALSEIKDIETLKMMREEYPRDEVVARALARELSGNMSDASNKTLLETLIQTFHLKRSDYVIEAPRSFTKDKYSVSVIMPFMASTLEPTPGRKRNQIVLDFYEGMKLAADTLNKNGMGFSLRAYDTERDNAKIRNLLGTEELKNTDLIIGPFFPEESKPILDFSLANRINVFNPFVNNNDITANNPFSYLFQPANETLGRKSGEFLAAYATKKNCLVIAGTSRRDSIVANAFSQAASEKGLKIVGTKIFPKENVRDILAMLATGTEFDEFKNPKEFTLKKDSLGSIFVASDDPLLYAKVISGVETRVDKIVVLGSEAWLEHTVVDFEKYQTLPIVLAAPNFISTKDPELLAFTKKYIRTHGKVPSTHAKMGYELMMFAGSQMRQHGVYFQEALNRVNYVPGVLYQGFNYQFSRNNQFVPFIRYEGDGMKMIEKY